MEQGNLRPNSFERLYKTAGIFVLLAALVSLSFFSRGLKNSDPKILGANNSLCSTKFNNDQICPAISLAKLPAAGKSYVDPVFGTTVIRVTDPTIAPSGATTASNPTDAVFNSNGTMFFVNYNNGSAHIFSYDRATQSIRDLGPPPFQLTYDGAQWDSKDPNVFYAVSYTNNTDLVSDYSMPRGIYQFTVTKTKPLQISQALLADFGQDFPYRSFLDSQLLVSQDSRYFAILVNSDPDNQDNNDYLAVWDNKTRKTQLFYAGTKIGGLFLNNFDMDPSGNYFFIRPIDPQNPATEQAQYLWDRKNDKVDKLSPNAPDYFSGPSVMDLGGTVHEDGQQFVFLPYSNPRATSNLIDLPTKNDLSDPYESWENTQLLNPSNPLFFTSYYVDQSLGIPLNRLVQDTSSRFRLKPFLRDKSYEDFSAPEVVRLDGVNLPTNRWSYEPWNDTLYVAPKNKLAATNSTNLVAFDWRPLMEEIVQFVKYDGQWNFRRLAHHYMQDDGSGAMTTHLHADPTGSLVLFTSNMQGNLGQTNGKLNTDVFLLLAPPLPPPPSIFSASATELTDTSAVINWTTDLPSIGSVSYGTTQDYDYESDPANVYDSAHSVKLTDLTPGTAYHFKVNAISYDGLNAFSSDFIFVTQKDRSSDN